MPLLNLSSRRGLILGGAGLLLGTAAFAEEGEPKPVMRVAKRRKPAKPTPPAPVEPPKPMDHVEGVDPEEALARLVAGNGRYVSGFSAHPNGDLARRTQVAAGQTPFASILACADSRVAPELIFDQGLGDLFVCRVAGNVVDDAILASLEYSVIHLGSTLIMVLGHERCDTVKAAIDALDGKGSPDDVGTKIGTLAGLITPSIRAVAANSTDRLNDAVAMNASHVAAEIFVNSPPLRARVLAGKLKIVAAHYDLDDGKVTPTRGERG